MELITVDALKARMDAGEQLHLVDVREPYEHAEFNIGGILHPLSRIMNMDIEDLQDWKQKEVICYCRSGQRSMQACLMLEQAGFSQVKNVVGGMMAWQANNPG
jgi:rhodanese-related sulfurtransferase